MQDISRKKLDIPCGEVQLKDIVLMENYYLVVKIAETSAKTRQFSLSRVVFPGIKIINDKSNSDIVSVWRET